jgi:type IV pilus assembly protein PilE
MNPRSTPRMPSGFTLVEVLIVMVIMTILLMVVLPSYREAVQRGHRADARTALMTAAQLLERQFTVNNTYCPPAGCSANPLPDAMRHVPPTGTPVYTITVTDLGVDRYTLNATPTDPGPVAGDACGRLTLNSTNERGQERGTQAQCWRR